MRVSRSRGVGAALCLFVVARPGDLVALPAPAFDGGCSHATLTGEVMAGQRFQQPLGGGLSLMLDPIASGWILRVLPAAGPSPAEDYAQLATPPYNSVSPLSISTDFAFRAQDAIGWNPRRFRFAPSPTAYAALRSAYAAMMAAGTHPAAALESRLAAQVAHAAEGTLTILDARLVPGTADQWQAAAAVASHFNSTAHTLALPAEGKATPLGRIVGFRFRIDLDLPFGLRSGPAWVSRPAPCAAS